MSSSFPSLHPSHSSFSNSSVASPTSQLIPQSFFRYSYVTAILQPFRCFTYVTSRFPTFPSLHLRHSSFSSPSVASPTLQLILQPFRRFTYVTAHSPTLLLLHLRHSSFPKPSFATPTSQPFSNPSVASPMSQVILQPFRRFTYVTAHSPTLPSLYLRHSPFSNPSVASPTSQLILQPFFRFSYVTGSSLTSPAEPPMDP